MTTISAKVIADSVGRHSPRLTTLLLRYPRWIHAEFMTHRVFSRNAASSRAIPVARLIQDVESDPAVPLFWGKNQKGMQAGEECSALVGVECHDSSYAHFSREEAWLAAQERAVDAAKAFAEAGYHKQIVNRLLEPFSHITVVVTATQWSNFFALRRHADAEPHIRLLADRMWEAMGDSTPQLLQPGEWHLPFVNVVDANDEPSPVTGGEAATNAVKLSVARCASTSFKTVDGFDMTLERAIDLHDKLVSSTPLHASPCEHQARMDEKDHEFGWPDARLGGNLGPGWAQYRKMLPGECI